MGATVNQFVLQAALKEADRVIEHERVIMPSARDAKMILESLDLRHRRTRSSARLCSVTRKHSVALQIELLVKKHDRHQFDCGETSLNEWLQRMALQQQQEKNYARTRVIVESDEPTRVLGYYALLPTQVGTTYFPPGRKLPKRLPCLLLGRLAVDGAAQARRLAELLLIDALERTRRSIAEIGGAGLYADVLNERAAAFYMRYGFQSLLGDPKRLFLALQSR